ncbi:MAG TPA: FecR family protein [Pantanalinema sp.]
MRIGSLLTLMIAGWLALGQAALAAGLAHLVEIKGEVQVLSPGSADWRPGREDEELSAGDSVRTAASSEATVVRNDGTTVSLLPFAQLVIEDEQGFMVRAGRVWSHFTKALGAPFFIRTPDATALIRGTTLGVGYEEERSRVTVYEGLVEVRDREERSQDVAGGFRVEVDRLGRLQRLERAEGRELDEGRAFRLRRGLERLDPRGADPAGPRPRGAEGRGRERLLNGPMREQQRGGRLERQELRQQRMDKVDRRLEQTVQRIRQDRTDRQEQQDRQDQRNERQLDKQRRLQP